MRFSLDHPSRENFFTLKSAENGQKCDVCWLKRSFEAKKQPQNWLYAEKRVLLLIKIRAKLRAVFCRDCETFEVGLARSKNGVANGENRGPKLAGKARVN